MKKCMGWRSFAASSVAPPKSCWCPTNSHHVPAVDIPPLSLFFPSLVGSTREVEGNHTTSPKAIKTQMFFTLQARSRWARTAFAPAELSSPWLFSLLCFYLFIYFAKHLCCKKCNICSSPLPYKFSSLSSAQKAPWVCSWACCVWYRKHHCSLGSGHRNDLSGDQPVSKAWKETIGLVWADPTPAAKGKRPPPKKGGFS